MNLTVGKLKELLNSLPEDMPVGRVGHFGEIHFMTAGDLYTRKAYYNVDENGATVPSWEAWRRGSKQVKIDVLDFNTPDIGEEPN